MTHRFLLPLPMLLTLAGCTVPADTSPLIHEASPVAEARQELIGLNKTDIRMCAGFPTRTHEADLRDEIWSYNRDARRGGYHVSLPTLSGGPLTGTAGSVSTTSSGSCQAQIRFHDGKVAQVEFAGDNNSMRLSNQLCTPIIDGCVEYAREGRHAPPPPPPKPEEPYP